MEEVKNNWIDAMIERFKNSTNNITDKFKLKDKEYKLKLVKEIDFEAFKYLFLLVVNGVLDINISIKKADITETDEYKKWHRKVLERDSFTCQECGSNKNLEVHHIKPKKFYPELAIELDNGLTLCNQCHKETNSYGGKINKYGREYRKTE